MKISNIILFFMLVFTSYSAWGHSTGENYSFININERNLEGHFEINLINLRNDLKLKIDEDNPLESIEKTAGSVQKSILEKYAIYANDKKLDMQFTNVGLLGEGGKAFAKYFFVVEVDSMPEELLFENTLFFDNNPRHRGLLLVDYNHKTQENFGEESAALIFSPENYSQTLNLNDIPQLLKRKDFVWQGILHILIGYDHILFLLALLLPTVLYRDRKTKSWRTEESFRSVLFNFIKIVTLFTIAHSITLTLAALGYIKINAPLVESIIAFSIILVVLNNIFPKFNDGKWLLIIVFGLFHGLGFASVMGQLPFRMVDLVYVMLFFNIGVELGQLAIVALLLPLLFFLSRYEKAYVPAVLILGSVVIGLVASAWFVERAFQI